ncbi:hypothetical protein Btru_006581 [Bulinus truncatus]|nr:hypothetical protein Btru_006581 [Bulinus truncatus]
MNTTVVYLVVTLTAYYLMQSTEGRYISEKEKSPSGVFNLIHETINKSQNGIQATHLNYSAQLVKVSADRLANGVLQKEAVKEVLEIADSINLRHEVKDLLNKKRNGSELFNINAKNIGVAFKIWEALAGKGEKLTGDLSRILSAISVVSDRIIDLLQKIVEEVPQEVKGRDTFSTTELFDERSWTEESYRSKRGGPIIIIITSQATTRTD